MDAIWTRVATRDALAPGAPLVVRPEGRQLALFDTPHGVLACNNRCPHEGYPLSEGTLDEGCVLTCNWHNWKFDLASGHNLYGGDGLRTYPVEIRDGAIWVDLADPPFEERRAKALASLRDAFDDNDYARMARELGRLQLIGADPLDPLRAVVEWAHDRLEFGWTHGFAGLADWLEVRERDAGDDETRLACLLEAVGHVADDVLREPRYPYAEGTEPYAEGLFPEALAGALEREDEALAVRLVRGALGAGASFDAIEPGLARAALAHYNAFGHSAIYVTKARRLIERLGNGIAERVLLPLVRQIVFARREDLIPEFRGYADARERFGDAGDGAGPRAGSWRRLGIQKALDETVRASSAPPAVLFDALLGANAANLASFDPTWQERIDVSVSDNASWLDVTHGVTFAAAVRELCERHPVLWPDAMLQLACFTGRNVRYTLAEAPIEAWTVEDVDGFMGEAIESVIDHDVDEFIVSVHRLKTLLAARELVEAGVSQPTAETLLAGVNRYVHSSTRLKQVRRTVRQSLQFVAKDG